jgi:alpha-amylase
MKVKLLILALVIAVSNSCENQKRTQSSIITSIKNPFIWNNATIYFLVTDRFNNGDTSNDLNFSRTQSTGKLRGFEGGDIKGITKKIEDGYFNQLGVNAIWFTPVVEQIHGAVDEGTGLTYGYHGYWAKDWTALDPNFGTKKDLKKLVEVAHKNGIRIILDGVINHTGPVTDQDPVWPSDWVRTGPTCTYNNYQNTVGCTLTNNLPDVKTESLENVEIPKQLADKWKAEGRYEIEMNSLDAFFQRTGYPRAPKYYIIKWLTDFITEFGIDGYRADTVKHTEEDVWTDFRKQCDYAFEQWKVKNPTKVLDSNPFYLVGEVYNYGINTGKIFNFGDHKVDYFKEGFSSLINFDFKWNAKDSYEKIFSKYSNLLQDSLNGYTVLNYISSHDDSTPFDKERTKPFESATKLLLAPGQSQIYYGDESARELIVPGAEGDANLRSNMNWNNIVSNPKTQAILAHWQKLGNFRKNHLAIGAGIHKMISRNPYVFQRTYSKENYKDAVVIGLDLPIGNKEIPVEDVFKNGTMLNDAYSSKKVIVTNGKIKLNTPYNIVLLELNQ